VKIKKLELHGFKSFADPTEVELHEGVTAIVGPNGCGKSNISDAIRWVLGEQAPSAIRGSRMEEAIFGGTAERRPISRAEVNLTLSNEDGTLPVPHDEVVIGRTVYRGGESEYRLNDDVVRLRDIQDLCRDTGLGATEYSIIEGRMIDAILSDRAEERRALFEEAAEVGRYKDRRGTAMRRLEQARNDLERLEDVLGEVRTKVRSLAQQRGRAERYREYRDRRLRLEVAVAGARLSDLSGRIERAEAELEELRREQPAEESELRRRETEAENLRVEIAELERERSGRAAELDGVRSTLEERERRRIVAAERSASAERRIEQVSRELEALEERSAELEEKVERLGAELAREEERAGELSGGEERLGSEVEELRAARDEARREEERAEERLTELAREVRLLEADREAGGERIGERESELERARERLDETRRRAGELLREFEAARGEAERAEARLADLEGRLEEARGREAERRSAARELREEVTGLEGRLGAERTRVESLSSLLGSAGDLPAAVADLLAERADDPRIHGVLADFLEVPSDRAAAVEASLGGYLHGVVVEDWETVVSVGARLDPDGEGLVLLPLDPGPRPPGEGAGATEPGAGGAGSVGAGGSLLEWIEVGGAGAPWARALLSGVRVAETDELEPRPSSWARPDGTGQDAVGAVRFGQPGAGRGTLRRRAELAELEERVDRHAEALEERRAELEERESRLADARERVASLESAVAEAGRKRREAAAELETAGERLLRVRRHREELEGRIEELEGILAREEERAAGEADRLGRLRTGRGEAEEALQEARRRAARAHEAWEERRGELQDHRLRVARREADLSGLRERVEQARSALAELEERRERLEAEREEQRRALREAERTAGDAGDSVADLLERRDGLEEAVRKAERGLREKKEALEAHEAWLREARRNEREHAERRHRLELELARLRGRRGNIRERLEGEYDEPLEALSERVEAPEEGGPAEWAEELEEVRRKLGRLGPVNLLAAEEYEEEKERLDFLESQRDDLEEARDDLHDSIRRINRAAAGAFQETFEEVRANFQDTFESLFEGGSCDLWLADEEDPLDSPVEISASPRGKRTQRIHLLSGGERALTALALLFAIYRAKPSPFCVMDEVDAPLDESNIMRFVGMLERFKERTQFVVITHNPRTIESADWIYGVTMQEPGVSSVVGVEFGDLPKGQVA